MPNDDVLWGRPMQGAALRAGPSLSERMPPALPTTSSTAKPQSSARQGTLPESAAAAPGT